MDIETQSEIPSMINSDPDLNRDQFLSFFLDGEEYGVDILRVQEIKCWENATEIPNAPEYIKGVINLRGTIVPIVDLRLRFGLEPVEYTKTTVVIVLKVISAERERTVGFVVDAVSEVYNIENGLLQPPPEMGDSLDLDFVKGLTAINNNMVVLLDVDRLIEDEAASSSHELH